MLRATLFILYLLAGLPSHAATYDVISVGPTWIAQDGTTQPQGLCLNKVIWDGMSNFPPPAGFMLVLDNNGTVQCYTPPSVIMSQTQCQLNPFTANAGTWLSGLDVNCVPITTQPTVANISGFTGFTKIKTYNGITINPGLLAVGNAQIAVTVSGVATTDTCLAPSIASGTSLGTNVTIGTVQISAANTAKITLINQGVVGITVGSFTASMVCFSP